MNKFITFPFEVKQASDDGVIKGYASTFGNLDLGFDIVDRGAFAKTLQESKGRFPILADHNPTKQIGWNVAAEEDTYGLKVDGWLDIANNQSAREKHSLAKKGLDLGCKVGMSIGYATIKDEPDPSNLAIRHLKELKLYEWSLVTFPMNEQALANAAKQWLDENQADKVTATALVEGLIEKGYSEIDLLRALEGRAAKAKMKPGDIAHFLSQLKNIQSVFTN